MSSVLVRIEQLREEAAALLMRVTGGEHAELKPFEITGALCRSTLSRGRRGDDSNVIFRQDVHFVAFRQAGRSRADAEAILEHYATIIEELWPSAEIDYTSAIRSAQISDSNEDIHQSRALSASCAQEQVREIGRWIEAAILQIADARVAIIAKRRRRDELLASLPVQRAAA